MTSFRLVPLFLLLAAPACVPSTVTEGDGSSSGTTGATMDTTSTGTGILTTTTPTTGVESTTDAESTTTSSPGTSTDATTMAEDLCAGDAPHVLLATTLGDMVIKLDAVHAPNTVANFLEYVEAGFYDGTIFHRVVSDFVIQGGGFTPDFIQKPTNPPIALETSPALAHVDGAIGMARTDELDSATSQFYICDGAQPDLDGMYAVFGVLVSGFEVRDAIAGVAVQEEAGNMGVPVEDVIINTASCVATI